MDQVLMQQGVDLMLYGMGSVFGFLTLLVLATVLMSWIVRSLFPDPVDATAPSSGEAAETGQASADAKILKVIQSALEQHRKR